MVNGQNNMSCFFDIVPYKLFLEKHIICLDCINIKSSVYDDETEEEVETYYGHACYYRCDDNYSKILFDELYEYDVEEN